MSYQKSKKKKKSVKNELFQKHLFELCAGFKYEQAAATSGGFLNQIFETEAQTPKEIPFK